MPYGFNGKILHVDLTLHETWVEQPSEKFYREYMGGSAMALYYILSTTPSNIDAFDPRNILVLAASVLTGAPISGLSRLTVAAKSPLTNCIGDSQSGGFFPTEFKFSGFDAVVISGRSTEPVYLWLENGKFELRPAGHLWGHTTGDVQETIRRDLGDKRIEVLQCGIAGENKVRFANLMNNANRANGRTGMGAVMASKNLKAVAVRGDKKPAIFDPDGLRHLAKWGSEHLKESDVFSFSKFGTAGGVSWASDEGGFATRNWSSGVFEGSQDIDGATINEKILKHRDTCFACSIHCKPVDEIVDGPYHVDPTYGGPEYETLYAFGSSCGIKDLSAITYANQLCNMYGMDTISCGATIAWAMDCFEKGIITKEETGGLNLNFGNTEAMVQLVEMIAKREGFGNELAEGSFRAAEKIGRGSSDLVVTVKKQELPAHMPQLKPSLGLIYAVNPFGADHQSSEHDPSYLLYPDKMKQVGLVDPQPANVLNEEKVRFAFVTQCFYACLDSLNICQFVFGPSWQLYDPMQVVELVKLITGWDVTMEELLRLGEKRINLMRVFNMRENIDRSFDILPKKMQQPLRGGKSNGLFIDFDNFEKAKDHYYELAGWDVEKGLPQKEKMDRLGLSWLWDMPQ